MRVNFGAKPIVYPLPVFIVGTYNADGTPNAMNAAWGGISESDRITLCIDDTHKTALNLQQRGAFTVSMATEDTVAACDYVGIVSGNNCADKVARAGLHATPSTAVDAPLFDELPMALECRVLSYDVQTCCLIGQIVNVCADEAVLSDGRIDPKKLKPITFDEQNGTYLALGAVVGHAFADGNTLKD